MPTVSPAATRTRLERRTLAVPASEIFPLAVAALTVAAFVWRLSQIHQSLVGDELLAFGDIHGHSLASVISTVQHNVESSPPLFFILAWASAKLGDPTVWLRLPSVVLGTATVPVVYLIGRETVGRMAGLIGAAILALGPFALYFGVEGRPYATLGFFVALSTLALLRALATRSAWWWLLYSLSAAAAAYTHYTCVFVLAVQAAWSLWARRDRLREPLLANALIVLLYLPWLPHVKGSELSVYSSLWPLRAGTVLGDLLRALMGQNQTPLTGIPTVEGVVMIGVCALGGLVALAGGWWRARNRGEPWQPPGGLALLVTLAAATPVGLLLYSLLVTDLWLPRSLYSSLPAAVLVLGALVASLPRRLSVLAAVVVIATLVAASIRSVSLQYSRPPYRDVATYLDRVARPRDPVILVSLLGNTAIPVEWHKPHRTLSFILFWRNVPPGRHAYLVMDVKLARYFKLGAMKTPGVRLVGIKHYGGWSPTEVLDYYRPG